MIMVDEEIVNTDDGGIRFNFKGIEYQDNKTMISWLNKLLKSQYWKVKSGGVRGSDDFDAPVQREFSYDTVECILKDMKHIKNLDLESFYLIGEYEGINISFSKSIYGNKHASVYASDEIDAKIFLKQMGIE